MAKHFQGVEAAALLEVLGTHQLIAVHIHHLQAKGPDTMALLMPLLYRQDLRVKSFMNIEMMIRRDNEM